VSWTFVYLMFALKIPIAALLWIVWWAIHAEPEPDTGPGDGGISPRRHPRHPTPRRPRHRGPHGGTVHPSPPRTRHAVLRPRQPARHR
jgi:hypothetical protein